MSDLEGKPIRKTAVLVGIGAAIYFKDEILTLIAGQFPTSDESTDGTTPSPGVRPPQREIPDWYYSNWFQSLLSLNAALKDFIMGDMAQGVAESGLRRYLDQRKIAQNTRKMSAIKVAKAAAIAKAQAAIVNEKAAQLTRVKLKLAAVKESRGATLAEMRTTLQAGGKTAFEAQKGALISQLKTNAADSARIQSATERAQRTATRAAEMEQMRAAGAVTAEQQRSINHANAVAKEANKNRTILIGQNQAKTSKISMANFRFQVSKYRAKLQHTINAAKGSVRSLKMPKIPSARGTTHATASLFGLGVMVYDLVKGFYPAGLPPQEETFAPMPAAPIVPPNNSLPLCDGLQGTDGLHAKLCRNSPVKSNETYPSFPGNNYEMGCMPGYTRMAYGETVRCVMFEGKNSDSDLGNWEGTEKLPAWREEGHPRKIYYPTPGVLTPMGGEFWVNATKNQVNDWAYHTNNIPAVLNTADGIEDYFVGTGLRAHRNSAAAANLIKGNDDDVEFKMTTWFTIDWGLWTRGMLQENTHTMIKEQNIDDYPMPVRDAEVIIKGGEILTAMQKLTQLFPEMSEADKIAIIAELPADIPD